MKEEAVIFWFRRDLRLEDNNGLYHALASGYKVIPMFIYDRNIIDKLEPDDHRIPFIEETLLGIENRLRIHGKSLLKLYGFPVELIRELTDKYNIMALYANRDYEPYAIKRDIQVGDMLKDKGIPMHLYKDQVIFEKSDILKDDGKPYTVFTPYSKKWLREFNTIMTGSIPSESLAGNFINSNVYNLASLRGMGFKGSSLRVKPWNISRQLIAGYHLKRDFPSENGSTFLSPHLRFGTISIREAMRRTWGINPVFTGELIWREFFMQILYHFPGVENNSFRPEYNRINWVNDEDHFKRWCDGTTGFPLVDAGMRELSRSGYMHNRVRMVTASFLTRLLLTDWRWGETWFAGKLFDYELSSNNGNWQWAAGTGCDAAPWFRVFNPEIQVRKFDPGHDYIRKWIPEFGTPEYPEPIIDYHSARNRSIEYYRKGLKDF